MKFRQYRIKNIEELIAGKTYWIEVNNALKYIGPAKFMRNDFLTNPMDNPYFLIPVIVHGGNRLYFDYASFENYYIVCDLEEDNV